MLFFKNERIFSESDKLHNNFAHMRRTDEPLGPQCAREAPPGCPRARPGVPWQCPGSVRERPGSAEKTLLAMDSWTPAKHHKKIQKKIEKRNFFAKNVKRKPSLAVWRVPTSLFGPNGRGARRQGAPERFRERPGAPQRRQSRPNCYGQLEARQKTRNKQKKHNFFSENAKSKEP